MSFEQSSIPTQSRLSCKEALRETKDVALARTLKVPQFDNFPIVLMTISKSKCPREPNHGNDEWEPIVVDLELIIEGCPTPKDEHPTPG
jgi:hypothetical protein